MTTTPRSRAKKSKPFFIVGIGASAGGLAAFEALLQELPKTLNSAVIFIQHLLPDHPDLLHEILAKKFPLRAFVSIKNGLALGAGKIYLAPPGFEVALSRGVFRLTKPPTKGLHLPIDAFFSSLAKYAGQRSIAVVLSGAGTDGVRGASAIQDAGGAVLAQDPSTAEFSSMPSACIATGRIDAALSPAKLGKKLSQTFFAKAQPPVALSTGPQPDLTGLFARLKQKTAFRFEDYKENVVLRRVQRRMGLYGITKVEDYIDLLDKNSAEPAQLATDMLIGVTGFFRDISAWNDLKREVIKPMIHGKRDGEAIRVWTPACSSGEEPYSIAMMLAHEIKASEKKIDFQVFATDINEMSLTKAREGTFAGSFSIDIPPRYLRTNFDCLEGDKLQAGKELRDHIVFARQNILIDPPFSKLDLIICRNLLIYLKHHAQEKCIALFHYALLPKGYLFLGNAESVGHHRGIFKSLGKKNSRIYQRFSDAKPSAPFHPPLLANQVKSGHTEAGAATRIEYNISTFTQEMLLAEYAPPAVTVNDRYEILSLSGSVERFLQPPTGRFSPDFISWVPHGMRNRLRGALFNASHDPAGVCVELTLPQKTGGGRTVTLRIRPFKHPIDKTNLYVIVFEDTAAPRPQETPCMQASDADKAAIRQLEQQLGMVRDELQNSTEEFRSANEELHSSNEELQAANEEMETSREELQSLNEELLTVNNQLQSKIEEQESTNNDLHNFFSSTDIPTLFLDLKMQVKRFTPALTRLTKLVDADVGRPIADLSPENLGDGLLPEARRVLETLIPIRREMAINKVRFIRTLLPYRTSDNRIQGVVVTYIDITELKAAEESVASLAKFPEENINPVMRVSRENMILYANPACKSLLASWRCMVGGVLKGPLAAPLSEAFAQGSERTVEIASGGSIYSFSIVNPKGTDYTNLYGRDVTARKLAEAALAEREEKFRSLFESSNDALLVVDLATNKFVDCNQRLEELTGFSREDLLSRKVGELAITSQSGRAREITQDAARNRPGIGELTMRSASGELIPIEYSTSSFTAGGSKYLFSIMRDLRERNKAEAALRESEEKFKLVTMNTPDHVLVQDADLRYEMVINPQLGLTEADMLGKTDVDILTKDDAENIIKIKKSVLETGNPIFVQAPLVAGDGSIQYFEGSYIARRNAQGSINGIVGYFRNVTERKHAEQESARDLDAMTRLRRLGTLFVQEGNMGPILTEIVDAAIAITGADFGNIQLFDPASGDLRIAAQRGFPRWWLEFWNSVAKGQGCCGTALERGERVIIEDVEQSPIFAGKPALDIQRKAGVRAVQSTPLIGRSGQAVGMFSTHYKTPRRPDDRALRLLDLLAGQAADIIDRARTLEALRESEERYRSLFENLNVAAVLIEPIADKDGKLVDMRYIMANPSVKKHLGKSSEEIVGKSYSELWHAGRNQVFDIYEKVLSTGEPFKGEILLPALGKYFDVSAYRPFTGRLALILSDISDRKKAQETAAADLAALTRMHALSARAVEAAGIEPLLQEMMDIAVAILRADKGTLQLLEGETLRIAAQHGHERPFLDYFAAAENVASVCGEATRRGKRVVVPDVENSPIFTGTPSLPVLRAAGVRAVQSTPLVTRGGRLLGILTTHWTVPHTPDEHNLWRLDLLTRQTADLVEQKQAEAALKTSLQRMNTFIANIHSSILLVGTDGVVSANQAFCDYFDLHESPADLVGGDPAEMIEKVRKAYLNPEKEVLHIKEILDRGVAVYGEEIAMKNGRVCLRDFIPIFAEGISYGRIWQHTDITERKLIENKLRETRDYLDKLIQYANAPIIVWSPDMRITRFNGGFERLTGYKAEEVLGGEPSLLFPASSRETSMEEIERALKGERWEWVEIPILRKDGTTRVALWNSANIYGEDNATLLATIAQGTDITDRKEAEEALRRSESRWNAAIESFAEGAIIATEDERVIYWNPAAQKMHGFTHQDEGIGPLEETPATFQLWTPDGSHLLELDEWPMRRIKRGETVRNLELRIRRPDQGWEKIFSYSGVMVDTAGGERLIFLSCHDLTALRESEMQFRRIIETANEGVIFAGIDGKIDFVNQKMADMLGYPPEEIIGKVGLDFMPDDQKEKVLANRAKLHMKDKIQEEFCFRRKDGSPLWTIGSSAPILNDNGEHAGNIAMHTDITDRKAHEHDLDKLNRTLRALGKSSQAMLRANNEREFLKSVCAIILEDCGYKMVWIGMAESDAEKSVRPVESCGFEEGYLKTLRITWADTELGQGPTGKAIRTGKVSICKNMLIDPALEPWRKEALARGYASSIALPLMEDGTAFGALAIYSEKPDPFFDEEVGLLTELADDLAHGITVLRLRQAREKIGDQLAARVGELAAANKELESFAYSVSHDLRAPLRTMHSFSGMLMEDYHDKLDETGQDYLSRIVAGSIKMNALIDDIMSLSQISRQEMKPSQVNLSEIVANILHDLQQTQPRRMVETVIAPDVRANADERLIRVALTNLLQNAWKYTGKKENAYIQFGVKQSPEGLTYFVRDNGAGFDMRHASRLFTAFVRLHAEKDFPGTGIGLAIVNRVIARHGGKVWAEAKPGEGACFWFSLPLRA